MCRLIDPRFNSFPNSFHGSRFQHPTWLGEKLCAMFLRSIEKSIISLLKKKKKKKTAKYRWERNIARINGKVGSSRSSGVKRILLKSFELMDAANRWRGLIEPCTPNRVFPRISISSRVFTLITNSGAYARATSRWARKQENFHQPLSDRIIFA